jgi:protein AIR1/2
MDTESELAQFLAEADQSRLCRKCKQPGHLSHNCPHLVCTTCGKFDDHERRDCPWSLICFGCGQRGHRRAVSSKLTKRDLEKADNDRSAPIPRAAKRRADAIAVVYGTTLPTYVGTIYHL